MSATKPIERFVITEEDYKTMYDKALQFISKKDLFSEYVEFIEYSE